jgi:hypothetical protein
MSVLVHTCQSAGDDSDAPSKQSSYCTFIRDIKHLNSKRRYYTTDPKFESFKPVPLKCACRKYITNAQADEYVRVGKALVVYHPKGDHFVSEKDIDVTQIVMPLDRAQTPRVDMITKTDIERAYVYEYKKDIKLIEEIHKMILEERAKLIAPFREDPYGPGRLLFPFGPDNRTSGGHA